jgi:homospermidine synthase
MKFSGQIVVLGCGSVAQCLLPLLFKHLDISASQVTVIDFIDQKKRIEDSLKKGVRYRQERITRTNYPSVLGQLLKKGDLLLDLAWELDTVSLIDWCHGQGVLYLNTSVEVWDSSDAAGKDPRELTLYHRQMNLEKMVASWGNNQGPTAIVDHGANPGLVSSLVKQALFDISAKIIAEKPTDPRLPSLLQAREENNFPLLAHLIGLKTIHISERDTQITHRPKEPNEFVNTWSVAGLIEEGLAPAELGWGTHEFLIPKNALFHQEGPGNQICLTSRGVRTWVQSWVPSGPITGMVIRHGEAYGLSHRLSLYRDGELLYRPTVHYAYCPSDSAINSLHEFEMRHYVPQEKVRILSDEIVSGKDELGCLLMGHDFGAWWIGSVLSIDEARSVVPHQSATTVQVASSCLAALLYLIAHPERGLLLPDDLDPRFIIDIARPYLGQFLSIPVNWSPLDHGAALADYLTPPTPEEAKWQFATFLLGATETTLASN